MSSSIPLCCSFDDEARWEARARQKLIPRGITIRNDLSPGDHILRCELLEATPDPGGGHEFRIISVMRSVPFISTARNVRNGAD